METPVAIILTILAIALGIFINTVIFRAIWNYLNATIFQQPLTKDLTLWQAFLILLILSPTFYLMMSGYMQKK